MRSVGSVGGRENHATLQSSENSISRIHSCFSNSMLHLIILQRSLMFRRMLILQHSTHTGVRVTAEGLKQREANTVERTGTDLSHPQWHSAKLR